GGVLDNPDFRAVLNTNDANTNDALVPSQEAAESHATTDDFPALSIKDVFPEKDQASLPEQMAHSAAERFEIETPEIVDTDSPSGAEEFPALTIKDVFPEKDQPSIPQRMAHPAFQHFETETSELADVDSASLLEYADSARLVEPGQQAHHSPAFTA